MAEGEGAEAQTTSERDSATELQERIDILSAFTGGILFDFDREGRYLRVWTADPQLLARPAEELIGKSVSDVVGPVAGARFHDAFREVFDTGEPRAFEYALDVPAGRRTFSCEMRARAPRGGVRTVTLLTRDITAAKELEGKLVQAERLAALGLLAASVGHEIRQPLSYVLASLDVLERALASANIAPHAQSSLSNIRSGAKRIAEIAASLDLLAGRRPRTKAPIEVRIPLQAALDLCASELAICARVDRDIPELPLVFADESELCQVFANLLLNAAQAGGPGTQDAAHTVTITGAVVDDHVRISVADAGMGISAEHLPHVFDPYFTTKDKGRGTGLGLFISRSLVEAHGGKLQIASTPGKGTTVDVLLPIAAPVPLLEEPTTDVPSVARRRRLRVLLVDDEPRFLESLKLAIEHQHAVETHQRAREALAVLDADPTRYDVVLCDLAMPDIDGATFYEHLLELGVADRFVLMTGGAFTPHAAEFVASGRCPTIGKPFPIERLLTLLDEVSHRRTG